MFEFFDKRAWDNAETKSLSSLQQLLAFQNAAKPTPHFGGEHAAFVLRVFFRVAVRQETENFRLFYLSQKYCEITKIPALSQIL